MTNTIELHFTSDPRLLCVLRAAVGQVCLLAGFTRRQSSKVVLAVDEACANVIKHAYKGKSGQPITVVCAVLPSKLEITILDYGEPVDARMLKPRRLDDVRPGGLGIHLIKSVMDEFKYVNGTEAGNRLILSKNLPERKKH
jgi:anti-sigma regulatory factor (Ser/Thr protein kinase)